MIIQVTEKEQQLTHTLKQCSEALTVATQERDELKDKLDSSVHGQNQTFDLCKLLEAERDKLNAAAQLALDAVEWAQSMIDTGGQSCQEAELSVDKAYKALKKALK